MKRKYLPIVLILMLMFSGCAMFQTTEKTPFTEWSSKKKLTYAINVYSSEYDKYMAALLRSDLSDSQKDYLKIKRKVLVGLDKTIGLIIPFADANEPIPTDLENELMVLLTQLGYQPL